MGDVFHKMPTVIEDAIAMIAVMNQTIALVLVNAVGINRTATMGGA
jgi:hypothetical protein